MGKQKLYMGVVFGAIAGGLTALCDKETRSYAKDKWNGMKESADQCLKHPSDTLRNVQDSYNHFHQTINANADNAINAIEQVEETVGKLTANK